MFRATVGRRGLNIRIFTSVITQRGFIRRVSDEDPLTARDFPPHLIECIRDLIHEALMGNSDKYLQISKKRKSEYSSIFCFV